jgi:hypothetical protein
MSDWRLDSSLARLGERLLSAMGGTNVAIVLTHAENDFGDRSRPQLVGGTGISCTSQMSLKYTLRAN